MVWESANPWPGDEVIAGFSPFNCINICHFSYVSCFSDSLGRDVDHKL